MVNGEVAPPAEISDNELYKHCFAGYQYRDQLIPQEFYYMIQTFSFLLTLMVAARSVVIKAGWIPQWWATEFIPRGLASVIGVFGLCALFAYSLDLRANATCKGRLRSMMVRLERRERTTENLPEGTVLDPNLIAYWHFIDSRKLRRLEWWAQRVSFLLKYAYWIIVSRRNPHVRPKGRLWKSSSMAEKEYELDSHFSATTFFRWATSVFLIAWIILSILVLVLPKFEFHLGK